MENQELKAIVTAAQSGSETAYQALVANFGSPLLGYFYRNTGNRAEAEDLVQELFLRLVKGLKKYREKERFEVWLFQMARHLVIDHWRKRKMPLAGEDCQVETDPDHDPHTRIAARETADELQQALARLSPDQREVIVMRYFSGLSFAQIAKAAQTPLGTALARAHRGLDKLRTMLSGGDT
jgi:RNA polymerase sigma-70 factor, ECF subfamily